MSEYVLEVKNLSKSYNSMNVVDNISLNVKKGRIYGFLGPNGAGKSTTIRMILGLIKSSNGNIEIFGKNMKDNKIATLSKIGALVESPSYYGHLSAYDNLKIWAELKNQNSDKIIDILKTLNLYEHRKKKVSKFSLGMKQRLGIAQALIGDPDLLILDEPTNGLDPKGIREIRNLLISLAKDHNKTILISSHLLSEMDLMVDDVAIINKGKVLFEGPLMQLKSTYDNCANLEEIFLSLTGEI